MSAQVEASTSTASAAKSVTAVAADVEDEEEYGPLLIGKLEVIVK